MWKSIDLDFCIGFFFTNKNFEKLSKQAVHRSCGELIDIRLKCFGTDDLLDFISRCSSMLNHLRLSSCYEITGDGLINALKRLPNLETLELSYIDISAEDIEVIGRNCPQLKSFKMKTEYVECDGEVYAIANSMPALRHLKLVGSTMDNDDQVKAILNGCPHLETLDIRGCVYLNLDENLEKVCRERIKDFNFKRDNIPEGYEESDDDDISDFYNGMDGYGFSSGSPISEEDDYDYWLGPPGPL